MFDQNDGLFRTLGPPPAGGGPEIPTGDPSAMLDDAEGKTKKPRKVYHSEVFELTDLESRMTYEDIMTSILAGECIFMHRLGPEFKPNGSCQALLEWYTLEEPDADEEEEVQDE